MTTEELSVWFQTNAGFCGCGDSSAAAKAIMDVLALHPLYDHHTELDELLPNPGVRYFVLYRLDDLRLTEHGGGVGGGWLTDEGEMVLAALRVEWDRDEMDSLFESRCAHGFLIYDASHDCMASVADDA